MKKEEEIREQLRSIYEHRLMLRINRKMKKSCRNCVYGKENVFDLGDFGEATRYICSESCTFSETCPFQCRYNEEGIEKEMIEDIREPSICGAKEPKIAALLWVLHEGKGKTSKQNGDESISLLDGILGRIKRLF